VFPRAMRLSLRTAALSLLLASAIFYPASCFAPYQSISSNGVSTSFSSRLFALGYDPMRKDMNVVFGSGADEEDIDTVEGDRQREQQERMAKIETLLESQEQEFRDERRRKVWGKFSNATTREEVEILEREEALEIAKENDMKASVARDTGVILELLEPKDDRGVYEDPDGLRMSAGSSWFKDVDEELKQEWTEMGAKGTDTQLVGGKIVSRDALKGVRVGSAGGWTLEVFPGDFVVHRKYGIGRFEKLCLRPKTKLTQEEKAAQEKRRVEIITSELRNGKNKGATQADIQAIRTRLGTDSDTDPISNPQSTVLEIMYADGIVHVPVERAYRLSRYRAGDAVIKPNLSKVRGDSWRNAKKKVEENTLEMAQDVLALYATRETLSRTPFDPSAEAVIKKFEMTFPFEPTPDQKTCFEDVENDMVWRSRPMDRLICGDVGFGKTEIALRALFRAVVNGRQGALLAPTGVLAAQHFKNVLKRMGPDTDFPCNVILLRGGMGKNTKAGKELREKIANGETNLIVGTHALLSNDLGFKDLGLLVVDEEQRFGVKQKERLKLICSGIDVLTMSATPIPRTLQMSLSGIRDTSTLRSPPPMRKPVETVVQEMNDDIIYEAISRELARGGQCYYVVPRIAMIDDAQEKIEGLHPGIRVIQAHGRMGRNGAEDNVAEFAEGKYDVLLATTVIENGVDIPTVNTIIIQSSQAFGMSTLYQLRGRVGRSDKQAYAYFLYKEDSVTEQAAMRLQAIGELNELGSGFDVANRDLEIRGAGSLLGTEQSGMAAKVGFDLYMRMLKKSIRQLRGLDLPVVLRTNIILPGGEASIEVAGPNGTSHAFKIPDDYIPDKAARIAEETAARLAESTANLVDLTNRWKDSYGALPQKLQAKLKTMHLHACMRRLGVDLAGLLDRGDGQIDCVLRSPGLRPRHWAQICSSLPKGTPTKNLNVIFPGRFTMTGEDEEFAGGNTLNLKALLTDPALDDDAEEWDSLDQEEVEAMKEISSALNVKSLDEVDLEQYPRFVVPNFGTIREGHRVDALLKLLLPSAKIVFERQEEDKGKARAAAELREKRELLKKKKKELDNQEDRRLGYNLLE